MEVVPSYVMIHKLNVVSVSSANTSKDDEKHLAFSCSGQVQVGILYLKDMHIVY